MSGRVITVGEAIGVLRGEALEHAASVAVGTGGAEANVAIGLSRLHVPVTWAGRVGDDGVGRRIVRDLRAEGVNVRPVIDRSAPTALLLKERTAGDRTRVTYWRRGSAGSRIEASDVLPLLDEGQVDLLHVTGITASLGETANEALRRIVLAAVERRIQISFDVNHRASLWNGSDPRSTYGWFVERANIVFAGIDEVAAVVGPAQGADRAAARLAAMGPDEVVVKLGDAGALAYHRGERETADAVPVTVIDTVGAGDAFVAGYLSERLSGSSLKTRLATAVKTGAAVCQHAGDWEGALRRDELAAFGDAGDPVLR